MSSDATRTTISLEEKEQHDLINATHIYIFIFKVEYNKYISFDICPFLLFAINLNLGLIIKNYQKSTFDVRGSHIYLPRIPKYI